MSKIQSIQPNYQLSNSAKLLSSTANNPSFSGIGASAEELAVKAYSKNMESAMGLRGKIASYINKNDGEVQNQLVNALFTTTLAPAFIAYNPLSKEDKKTREYTALRQPISAVIAIAFGLGVTMPFNKFMENMACKGTIEGMDLRMDPKPKYLERLYKKEYKQAEQNGTLEQFKKENTPKNYEGKFGVEAYSAVKKEQAKETFKRLIYEKPEVLKNDTKLQSEIKDLSKYVDENNIHSVDFKDFMKDNFKSKVFKANEGGALKEEALKNQLHEITAMDFLRKTGLIKSEFDKKAGTYAEGSFTENELKAFLASKRQESVATALEKAGMKPGNAKNVAEEIGKETARQLQRHSPNVNKEIITLNQMLEALKIDPDKFVKDANTKKVATILEEFSTKHLKDLKQVKGKGLKDIAGNLLANKIKTAGSNFKNFNKYTGIVVALASLPFSCGTLNWAYPRIVERCFPSLVKNDSKKGGSK